MKNTFLPVLVFCACLPFFVSGCVWVGAGAAVATGAAASQEGGIRAAVNDTRIRALISDLWFKYDLNTFAKLDLTVDNGRVLITGIVQNPDHRVEAVRLAWQPEGVQQVINEIRIAESTGIKGYARDTWITTRLRTAIMFEKEVQSLNYSIDTVQGTVYLMGVAQSQAELDKVIAIARTIDKVEQVVSYVKISTPIVANGQGG